MERETFQKSGLDHYLDFVLSGLTVSDPESLFLKYGLSAIRVNNTAASGSRKADEMLHLYCHLVAKFFLSSNTCEIALRVSV